MDPPLSVDRARCSLSLSPKDIPVRGIFFATSRDKPLTIIYYSRNSFRTCYRPPFPRRKWKGSSWIDRCILNRTQSLLYRSHSSALKKDFEIVRVRAKFKVRPRLGSNLRNTIIIISRQLVRAKRSLLKPRSPTLFQIFPTLCSKIYPVIE